MEYVVGDRPLLKVTCEEDGVPINLTSSTLKIYIRFSVNGAVSGTPTKLTKTDASAGIVEYRWLATDLSSPGHVDFEVFIVDDRGDSSGDAFGTITADDYIFTSQVVTRSIRAKL